VNALVPLEQQFEVMEGSREQIMALENAMLALPAEQRLAFDNRHDFCPGIYARTIFMPAGMVLTSQIHLTQHFFIVVKGSCTVIGSDGSKRFIEAPYMGVTMPGTKRALHIHEDCIWTTFHATDSTDVDEIGKKIMAQAFEEIPMEKAP